MNQIKPRAFDIQKTLTAYQQPRNQHPQREQITETRINPTGLYRQFLHHRDW